ncbi:hypothetical protein [Macrococcus brunensis]|uniref:hypothetical protein n=1 Tax=Macrococcus brunensis TaxID=198483 RepID=UPI001EEF8F07|nr:hypothetical protein [Macrococcus brunensis]ULG73006.1 hypothetical protein MGG12_05675 [Macrococcus brunensis]
MKSYKFLEMHELDLSSKDIITDKYVTHDDHHFIEARDKYGNKFEIKFYPAEERGEE